MFLLLSISFERAVHCSMFTYLTCNDALRNDVFVYFSFLILTQNWNKSIDILRWWGLVEGTKILDLLDEYGKSLRQKGFRRYHSRIVLPSLKNQYIFYVQHPLYSYLFLLTSHAYRNFIDDMNTSTRWYFIAFSFHQFIQWSIEQFKVNSSNWI